MSFLKSILSVMSPPNKAVAPFLKTSTLSAVLCAVLGRRFNCRYLRFFSKASIGFFGFCLYFFRDPKRYMPKQKHLALAPADGRIVSVSKVSPPKGLGMDETPVWRVSIFLSVLNVHINRIPVDGKITAIAYHKGQFLNASMNKASDKNERNGLAIECPDGRKAAVVQIAGFIARRIICHSQVGQTVQAGDRFGMICFGSRTDLYLPQGCEPLVRDGQTMIGGETVIANLAPREN